MKNVLNLIKYYNNFRRKNTVASIVMSCIGLVALIFINFFEVGSWDFALVNIPIVSIVLLVYFIESLVGFCKMFTNNRAKSLFLLPVSGCEVLLSKYIEFIAYNFGFSTLVILLSKIGSGNSDTIGILVTTLYSLSAGYTIAYIIFTTIYIISSCYFKKKGQKIALTIVGYIVISCVIDWIINEICALLPHVYILINGLEIGVFQAIIKILCLIALVVLAYKHIDRYFEIN